MMNDCPSLPPSARPVWRATLSTAPPAVKPTSSLTALLGQVSAAQAGSPVMTLAAPASAARKPARRVTRNSFTVSPVDLGGDSGGARDEGDVGIPCFKLNQKWVHLADGLHRQLRHRRGMRVGGRGGPAPE